MRVFIAGSGVTDEDLLKAHGHTLTCDRAVERISFDEQRLACTATVCLQDIDSLDWVLDIASAVNCPNREHGINSHGSKEVIVSAASQPIRRRSVGEAIYSPSDDLTRHTRLGCVDESLPAQLIDLCAHLVLHKPDSLPTCEPVSGDDRGGVDLLLHELVRAPEKLSCYEHDGGRPITDFLVLLLRKVDKNSAGGMLDRKEG